MHSLIGARQALVFDARLVQTLPEPSICRPPIGLRENPLQLAARTKYLEQEIQISSMLSLIDLGT